MLQYIIVMLFAVMSGVAYADVPIDAENFPDPELCSQIQEDDKDCDGILTDKEVAVIKYVSVSSSKTLKGIEYLTNLRGLTCYGCHNLTELDLSRNKFLSSLYCNETKMRELDLTNNEMLTQLNCGGITEGGLVYGLESLKLSEDKRLTKLYVGHANLEELDLSSCISLEELTLDNAPKLEHIELRNCTKLTSLHIWGTTTLRELNVSSNVLLQDLICNAPKLTQLDLDNNVNLQMLQAHPSSINAGYQVMSAITRPKTWNHEEVQAVVLSVNLGDYVKNLGTIVFHPTLEDQTRLPWQKAV